MTSVKHFHSAMTGAPVLSGTAGTLLAVLDACLVTGFGLKTADSLTVASGVATVAFSTGHSFAPGTIALIEGATPAGLNGEKRILSTAANSVTFAATGIADGAATGTISAKLAPAGWEKAFPGTNVAAYRPSDVTGTRMYLRVDDTGATNARVVSYEAMTDISTGTNPIPLAAQVAGGLWWPKSATASATARGWRVFADSRGVYVALEPNGGDRWQLMFAGDIASLKSGDAYGWLVTGNTEDMSNSGYVPQGCLGYSGRNARAGGYLARAYTGIGQAIGVQLVGSHHNGGTVDVYAGMAGYAFGGYPNGPNNGLLTGVLELVESAGIRGSAPGLLHPLHNVSSSFATGAAVDGTNDLVGRSLMALRTQPASGYAGGTAFIDITGPWSR